MEHALHILKVLPRPASPLGRSGPDLGFRLELRKLVRLRDQIDTGAAIGLIHASSDIQKARRERLMLRWHRRLMLVPSIRG
eukprot:6209195-Pleurochrysis_carterae.AAC.4